MAQILFIHNPHDKISKELLKYLSKDYNLMVKDFMTVRDKLYFRGTPSVWIFADDQDVYADKPIWKSEVDVTLEEVKDALLNIRLINLKADNSVINIVSSGVQPTEAVIIATLTDINRNFIETGEVTFEVAGEKAVSKDGQLIFSSDTSGIFTIACSHPWAEDASIEIEVVEP